MAPPAQKVLDLLTRQDELQIETNRLLSIIAGKEPDNGDVLPNPNDYSEILKQLLDAVHKERFVTTSQMVIGDFTAESADARLETDATLGTTTPVLVIPITPQDEYNNNVITRFRMNSVKYYLAPANAVTYELYLLESSVTGTNSAYKATVFDSGAGKAGSTLYFDIAANMLPVDVTLGEAGKLYFLLDWSAAPGDTTGFVQVRGEMYVEDSWVKI